MGFTLPTDALKDEASEFGKQTGKLKRKYWWKNCKKYLVFQNQDNFLQGKQWLTHPHITCSDACYPYRYMLRRNHYNHRMGRLCGVLRKPNSSWYILDKGHL
ncbi:UNVERIFIED_CONTAM: hypothetical protein NCL1_24743 [Trichonephila clavipes]